MVFVSFLPGGERWPRERPDRGLRFVGYRDTFPFMINLVDIKYDKVVFILPLTEVL